MAPFVHSIEIHRPPEEVYAYATDPTTFSQWQSDVVRAEPAEGYTGGVGSRFTTTRRIAGADRAMVQEITERTPPLTWSSVGIDGPIRPNMTVTMEPIDGGAGTRATFALDFDASGMVEVLVPVVRRMAAKVAPSSYQALKDRLETFNR